MTEDPRLVIVELERLQVMCCLSWVSQGPMTLWVSLTKVTVFRTPSQSIHVSFLPGTLRATVAAFVASVIGMFGGGATFGAISTPVFSGSG